jgi:hypothetical protein
VKSGLTLLFALIVVGTAASCGSSGATPTSSRGPAGSPSPLPTPAGPSISGHVRDAAGSGIRDISVTAWSASGGTNMSASSGADGSYQIPGLVAGDYTVEFTDQLNVHGGGYYASSGVTLDASQATHVTLGTSPVSGIDVVLPTGHSLSGSVRQADGKPIPGVEVSVCPKGASGCTTNPTWTARDGTYTLPGIGAGTYIVNFSDPWLQQSPKVAPPDITVTNASISGYDLTAPAGWITPGAAIYGLTKTATGEPLLGVQVWVTKQDTTNPTMVKTAQDGSYFVGLAAGTYTIKFDEPISAYHGSAGMVSKATDAAPIVLSGSSQVEVDGSITLPADGSWKLFPTHVGSTQLVATSDITGTLLAGYATTIPADSVPGQTLVALGKTSADIVEIAQARDNPTFIDDQAATINIIATRYSGASATQLIAALKTAFEVQNAKHWPGCSVSVSTLAGKTVLTDVCNGAPPSFYEYAHGDVLFDITVKDQATAEAVLAALP